MYPTQDKRLLLFSACAASPMRRSEGHVVDRNTGKDQSEGDGGRYRLMNERVADEPDDRGDENRDLGVTEMDVRSFSRPDGGFAIAFAGGVFFEGRSHESST